MIEVHGFRDGSPMEERLTLGDAERLIQDDRTFVWIDVTDPQRDEVDALGAIFSLHPLTIEDAHHRHQRPKVELFEGYAFVVVHPLSMGEGADGAESSWIRSSTPSSAPATSRPSGTAASPSRWPR